MKIFTEKSADSISPILLAWLHSLFVELPLLSTKKVRIMSWYDSSFWMESLHHCLDELCLYNQRQKVALTCLQCVESLEDSQRTGSGIRLVCWSRSPYCCKCEIQLHTRQCLWTSREKGQEKDRENKMWERMKKKIVSNNLKKKMSSIKFLKCHIAVVIFAFAVPWHVRPFGAKV